MSRSIIPRSVISHKKNHDVVKKCINIQRYRGKFPHGEEINIGVYLSQIFIVFLL